MFRIAVVLSGILASGLAATAGSNPAAGIDDIEWLRLYSGGLHPATIAPSYCGEGYGVLLTPGSYPARLNAARFYFSGTETGPAGRWRVRVFDDDGPGDTCGTVLLDTLVDTHFDGWNTVDIGRSIVVLSGGFYVFAYCDTWGTGFQPCPRFRFDCGLEPDYLNHDSAPGTGHSFRRVLPPGEAGDPWFEVSVSGVGCDIAVAAIAEPGSAIDTAAPVLPAAWVANYGGSEAAARAWLTISDVAGEPVYAESLHLGPLGSLDSTLATFPEWPRPHAPGRYVVACSVAAAQDENPANDRLAGRLLVYSRPPLAPGWSEITRVPLEPSGREVKDGAWLCPVGDWIYFAKGYKVGDFYRYSFEGDSWQYRAALPLGTEGRPPGKGSAACTDGERYIYAVKGNNTYGFWRYDMAADAWTALPAVADGLGRRIKGGSSALYVRHPVDGGEYVYVLKGARNEFARYSIGTGRWEVLPIAPSLARPKWDKGSWLVHDGGTRIYAHKSRFHDFHVYDLAGDTWLGAMLSGMPINSGRCLTAKLSKEGGSAVWQSGAIYALKGGNTREFWRYDPSSDAWQELDTLPTVGSTGKRKRVKAGGTLCSYSGQFLAVKGSKSTECWAWTPEGFGGDGAQRQPDPAAQGEGGSQIADCGLQVVQNPSRGRATVRWSAPATLAPCPSTLSLYDASGRLVLTRPLDLSVSRSLSLPALAPGVYLLRVTGGVTANRKLVIE